MDSRLKGEQTGTDAGAMARDALSGAGLASSAALIATHTTDVALATDHTGRILWANAAFERLTGYGAEAYIGQKPGELLQGPETDPATVRLISKKLAGHESVDVEILNYNKAGDPYWLNMLVNPVFDATGKLTNFISIQQDITRHKQTEAELQRSRDQLRMVLDYGALPFWDLELNTGHCEFSENFAPILGGTPGSDGQFDFDWLLQHAHPSERRWLHRAMLRHYSGADLDVTCRFRQADGTWMWLRLRGRIVHDETGFPVRSLGVVSDITKIQSERVQAEERDRRKSEALAHTTHEIRNLLNGISGTTQVLLWSDLSEEHASLANRIRKNCEILHELVNHTLDLSRIEAGLLTLHPEPFAVSALVDEVRDTLIDQAENKGLRLVTRVDPSVPRRVMGDRGRIRQVLINLTGNAVKFSSEGEVCVCVGTTSDGEITFNVCDEGPGIPLADQPHLFERFRQVDDGRSGEGSGLGLAICAELVRLMGGSISIQSAPGDGAVFRIELPLERVDSVDAAETTADTDRPEEILQLAMGDARILLAEDDEISRGVITEMLSLMGITGLRAVDSGDVAVGAAGQERYDLMMFDQNLLGMDGATAVRTIRQGTGPNRRTPALLMSGNVGDLQGTLPENVSVLSKPLEWQKLIRLVSDLVTDEPPVRERRA
ncbi:hypothetical protein A3731_01955 [Roseovarius sp. HI0049]|nr:hypothetical protein A3731_01955 [Roseovarius sp. HI0049]